MSTEIHRVRMMMELRRQGVSDERVLAAIERIPRELFVARHFLDQAYEANALPIACGQTVSNPVVVGLMTQALEVGERMKVLEIGTGSGYQAAVLSRLCRRLYTVERHKSLLKEAEGRFHRLRLHNITSIAGDGTRGWPEQAPFDRIMVTAAASELPQALYEQLAIGGLMVLPKDKEAGNQVVLLVRRVAEGLPEIEELFPTKFVPLVKGLPQH
ncbi:MAG: protein-L-isoaspartate(D-aspartate) O-methyltransferase [Alphaproteobacteria bacterium]|nr:protein-L-isoaspartate(D-aspartate) O-methyltransferase [Alphaproteobacteria bacterium]